MTDLLQEETERNDKWHRKCFFSSLLSKVVFCLHNSGYSLHVSETAQKSLNLFATLLFILHPKDPFREQSFDTLSP